MLTIKPYFLPLHLVLFLLVVCKICLVSYCTVLVSKGCEAFLYMTKKQTKLTGDTKPVKQTEAEKKAVQKAQNEADKAAILAQKAEREAERTNERKQVKDAIKKLPELSLNVCTESMKPAINEKGDQMKVTFLLSAFFQSIGLLIDKATTDIHFYLNGCLVTLPYKGSGSSRCKNFVKSIVMAAFKKECIEAVNIATSLRAKYDFPIVNEAGQFIATEAEILRAMATHEKANNSLLRLTNLRVDNFGFNPEKRQIVKNVSEIMKAYKNEGMSEGDNLRKQFNDSEARKLLS